MGPIERELRRCNGSVSRAFGDWLSIDGFLVLRAAARSLGFNGISDAQDHGCEGDAYSEAIEAASELKL